MHVPKLIVCLRDYSWKLFRSDLGAGLVAGLVALPLAMAFPYPVTPGFTSGIAIVIFSSQLRDFLDF